MIIPFFGHILLGLALGSFGYPDSLQPSAVSNASAKPLILSYERMC
jgi:hypothetical protein